METVKDLTTEETLHVRGLQVAAQSAVIARHEFQVKAEADFKKLSDDLAVKNKVMMDYLIAIATSAGLDIEKHIFDFDHMAFFQR